MASGDAAEIVLGVGRVTPTGLKPLGSSFFVKSGVLATAAHVTEGDDRQLHVFTAKASRLNDYQDIRDQQFRVHPASLLDIDPVRDVAPLACEGCNIRLCHLRDL